MNIYNWQQLKIYQDNTKNIRVERKYPGTPHLHGFLSHVNKDIVVLQQFHDFYNEGYAVVKSKDVVDVRSDKHERFFEEIFRAEGLLDLVRPPQLNTNTDLIGLINYFLLNGNYFIVECESLIHESRDSFYIGQALEIEDDILWFRSFNALGRWETGESFIQIPYITKLQFDTPYINTFSRYLKPADVSRKLDSEISNSLDILPM